MRIAGCSSLSSVEDMARLLLCLVPPHWPSVRLPNDLTLPNVAGRQFGASFRANILNAGPHNGNISP